MTETIYEIIKERDLEEFEKKVTKALNNGFVLQGNLVLNDDYYLQAVTRQIPYIPPYNAMKTTTAKD